MSNKTYYKYTYNGVNSFTSPIYDEEISEIKAFVNNIEVNFRFLTSTMIKLITEPIVGDVVEILRVTSSNGKIIDFTNGEVLDERKLNKQNNQFFNLVKELEGNDVKDKTFLENEIAIKDSIGDNVDSGSWVSGNLNDQITKIQEVFDSVDDFIIDDADPDKIDITVPGTGNIPTSGNLTETITVIDVIDTNDTAEVVGSTGSIPDGTQTLETIGDYLGADKTDNTETTGDDVTVGEGTLTEELNNLNSTAPIISLPASGPEETQISVTITDYDPNSSYNAEISGGVIDSFVNNTLLWTLPSVTIDTEHNIKMFKTEPGLITSPPITGVINVTNVTIVPDTDIIYNTNFDNINTANNIGMDLSNNVLKPLQDNASIESVNIVQEVEEGDWILTNEEVKTFLKEIVVEPETTNTLIKTKELIVTGDKLLIDNTTDISQDRLTVGTVNEVVSGAGDFTIDTLPNTIDTTVKFNYLSETFSNGDTLMIHDGVSASNKRFSLISRECVLIKDKVDLLTGEWYLPNNGSIIIRNDIIHILAIDYDSATVYSRFIFKRFDQNFNQLSSITVTHPQAKLFGTIAVYEVLNNGSIMCFFDILVDNLVELWHFSPTTGSISKREIKYNIIEGHFDNNKNSLLKLSNGNLLFGYYNNNGSIITREIDTNGDDVSGLLSLPVFSANERFVNIKETANNYVIGGIVNRSWIINKSITTIVNQIDTCVLPNNNFFDDKIYLINSNKLYNYDDTNGLVQVGTDFSPTVFYNSDIPHSYYINIDGNISRIQGNQALTYQVANYSPGITVYDFDITSLGYTNPPTNTYYDPDILFSSSLVGTSQPTFFNLKTETSFNITALGDLEQVFDVGVLQGREYKWSVYVPFLDKVTDVWYVSTSMNKINL